MADLRKSRRWVKAGMKGAASARPLFERAGHDANGHKTWQSGQRPDFANKTAREAERGEPHRADRASQARIRRKKNAGQVPLESMCPYFQADRVRRSFFLWFCGGRAFRAAYPAGLAQAGVFRGSVHRSGAGGQQCRKQQRGGGAQIIPHGGPPLRKNPPLACASVRDIFPHMQVRPHAFRQLAACLLLRLGH